MGNSQNLLAEARKHLGVGADPNIFTKWYADQVNDNAFRQAPWCGMFVSYVAMHSGNGDVVLPNGLRAYTPWHAGDFQRRGQWKTGTKAHILQFARPGHVIFMDWGHSDDIDKIDHVGFVEVVLSDGRVQTLEGNTMDRVARRVRAAGDIAGFGVVPFTPNPKPAWPYGLHVYKLGDYGPAVRSCQIRLNYHGASPPLVVDGKFGPKTDKETKDFQASKRLTKDGQIGPVTGGHLWKERNR